MAISCFRIDRIPDLSLNKYQSLSDTGVDGVLQRHESFLRQWYGICKESETSFHLLYVFLPEERVGSRLQLYFFLQGDSDNLNMITPLLKSSPLSEFYTFKPASIPTVRFESGEMMIKKEQLPDIRNPLAAQTSQIHYVPKWEVNEDCRLYDLFRMIETVGQSFDSPSPCAYRVDVYPASVEHEARKSFLPVLEYLRGKNELRIDGADRQESLKDDSDARSICQEYEDWLSALETSPHFRVNIYSFAENSFKARILLHTAGAEALSEGACAIGTIREDSEGGFNVLSRMGKKAEEYCFYKNQIVKLEKDLRERHSSQISNHSAADSQISLEYLKSWSTTYCLSDIVPFFRFPVLFEGENIELPKETAPEQEQNGIYLGKDIHQYPVYFPLEDLAKHAFFTGMPGSGKTNTMLHLVTELRKKGIPFLALEPAKKEYRALLGRTDMQDIFLFSPHLQSHFPLRMNPFAFPHGVRLSEHITALLEVFEGSFVLEGPTRKFLSSSIEQAYRNLGWDIEDIYEKNCKLQFPTLKDVYDLLQEQIEESSYDGEIKGNVQAFLQVRLGGLMERDAGELFNSQNSTLIPEQWLQTSAIVELEVLGEQAKNFFVLLVCHYIFEALRADPNGGRDAMGRKIPIRHAVFIEEAHNIIAPSMQQSSTDMIDPKISATAYIMKMLAEVRALREAIIISDQLPTALAAEVTKNTGLKLVHRLISQDDRQQIGTAISASSVQMEQMATFTRGRALIYYEKTQKPFEVQIEAWSHPDLDYDIANESSLYSHICMQGTVRYQIQLAFFSWQDELLPYIFERTELVQMECRQMEVEHPAYYVDETIKLLSLVEQAIKKCSRFEKLWLKEENTFDDLRTQIKNAVNDLRDCRGVLNMCLECLSKLL